MSKSRSNRSTSLQATEPHGSTREVSGTVQRVGGRLTIDRTEQRTLSPPRSQPSTSPRGAARSRAISGYLGAPRHAAPPPLFLHLLPVPCLVREISCLVSCEGVWLQNSFLSWPSALHSRHVMTSLLLSCSAGRTLLRSGAEKKYPEVPSGQVPSPGSGCEKLRRR